ncbi:MAG: RNA polymerase sigma factor [Oscillospiraceae bacterium]|nr:RNA polymerase sigma factor [Oscillospiraceae bacterium]
MLTIETLYERYKDDVFRYLVSQTRDAALAEDLLSETFLGAIRSLPSFRGGSDIKTWLFSIARNRWMQHLRRKKPGVSLDELSVLRLGDSFSETLELRAAAARAAELLGLEDERSRRIFLRRVEGFSYFEIAREFGISEGSARVIDFRVRKRIRTVLEEEGFYRE